MNFITQTGAPYLARQLSAFQFPDQSGESGTQWFNSYLFSESPIGRIKWDLTNFQMRSLSLEFTNINVVPGGELIVSL